MDLIYHTNCYLPAFMTWPVNGLLGIAAANNTAVILALSLGALGFYLVARDNGASLYAGVIAGFAFAFTAFTFAHLPGHMSMLQIHFVAFALLFLGRILRCRRIALWNAIGLGAMVWATAVTDLTLLVTLLCLSVVVFFVAFADVDISWKEAGFNIGIGAGVCIVLVLPWAYALSAALSEHDYSRVFGPRSQEPRFYCTLRDLLVPPGFHGLWGRQLNSTAAANTALYSEAGGYLGIVCLLLLGCALWLRGTAVVWIWALAAAVFVSFTLGLNYANRVVSIWTLILPENFNVGVPLLDQVRVPSRFALAAHACIAIVCANGFDAVTAKLSKARRQAAFAGVLVVMAVDFWFSPIPIASAVPSAHYRDAKLEGNRTILELPLWVRSGPGPFLHPFAPRQLLDQTHHEKPLLSTYVSRIPKDVSEKYFSEPVIQHISALQRAVKASGEPSTEQVQDFLKRANVGWIVIPPQTPGRGGLIGFLKKTVPLGVPQKVANVEIYELPKAD